ncbi:MULTISPECIES: hypothetical protein [unclassified Streptomyces]|uniref:hypothetical protein n=2 Tax=Streptomyces TaxID=1883 RepID=UPI002E2FC436|nr:hypothetical protein [Streptomyces sp. NBC_01268]
MLPESTNGAGGGGLAVPMDWLCAEYAADDLLRTSGLVEPGSLEFRAGVQALALTVHLAGAGVEEWLWRTSHDHPWSGWVAGRLSAPAPEGPDLALARATWRQLRATELRAADLADLAGVAGPVPPSPAAGIDEERQVWLPAWQLGVALAHLALHLH